MTKKQIITSFCLVLLFACQSGKKHAKASTTKRCGILKDLRGLDGCTWVIELNDNLSDGTKNLEPVNIADFGLNLKDSIAVCVGFTKIQGASICMVGLPVTLTELVIEKR